MEPYEIWAGNPARLIRKRFDDETIEKLLQSKWFDWEDNPLKEKGILFTDVKKFIDNLEEK